MVFEKFRLGKGISIREFWFRIGYHLPYKQLTVTEIKFLETSKSGIEWEF